MARVTILGAGVVGMMVASQMPIDYDVTIVGDILPGDPDTKGWASPWAGAIWAGVHTATKREQELQLAGFAGMWRLALTNPESTVRRISMTEIMDRGSPSDIWYAGRLPGFRWMAKDELPDGALYGMKYNTVVLTPTVFVKWMRARLEDRGVKFKRIRVQSLNQLVGLGHDVLINASGRGSESLKDVQDKGIRMARLQCVILNKEHNELYIRRGPDGYYSTAFSRMDGTLYCGGVLTYDDEDTQARSDQRELIIRQQHANQPQLFPSPNVEDYDVLRDHVGVYPIRTSEGGGARIELQNLPGQKVVHAYGFEAGGYVYSYGMAREVVRLANDAIFELHPDSNPNVPQVKL